MPTWNSVNLPTPQSWDEFEEMVADIARSQWGDSLASRYGRQGQAQQGVDIHCRPEDLDGHRGIQCKNTANLEFSTVEEEIEKAEDFEPTLDEFVIATTAQNDATLQRKVRKLSEEHEDEGQFQIRLLMWEDLSGILASDEELRETHYPQFIRPEDDVGDPSNEQEAPKGFDKLNERFFNRYRPETPRNCWRIGFNFSEIREGYHFERQSDGGDSIAENIIDKVTDSKNLVILGPPGSGKSTICRSIATKWYDSEYGDVFYRKRDVSDPIDEPESLISAFQNAEEHVLVVVEDIVRTGMDPMIDVLDKLEDDPDITFLFDARTSEWTGESETSLDPRSEHVQMNKISEYHINPLSVQECSEAVEFYEALTESSLGISGEEIYNKITGTRGIGEMILLANAISQYGSSRDYVDDGEVGSNVLEYDIRTTYDNVLKQPGGNNYLAEVSFLINLLNASRIDIRPEYLHALGHSQEEHRAISRSLDKVEGELIFSGEGSKYRSRHELWSTLFLERTITREGVEEAVVLFERAVNSLFSIIENSDHRKSVEDWFRRDMFFEISGKEQTMVCNLLARSIFILGTRHPNLAPLFREDKYSNIHIPESCSSTIHDECRMYTAVTNMRAGNVSAAESELERIIDEFESRDSLNREERKTMAFSRLNIGNVARKRGEIDTAINYYERCVDSFKEIDDHYAEAISLTSLGNAKRIQGNQKEAADYLKEGLGFFEEVDDHTRAAKTLNNLGITKRNLGDIEDAEKHHENALKLSRDVGHRQGEGEYLNSLGIISQEKGESSKAEDRHKQSLEIFTDLGYRWGEAKALLNLGKICLKEGDAEGALEYFERSLEIEESINNQQGMASCLINIGVVHKREDNYEGALEVFRQAIELMTEIGTIRGAMSAYKNVILIHLERGDLKAASSACGRALSLADKYEINAKDLRMICEMLN